MITYGVKGMAAYAEHAKNIGKEDKEIYSFIYEALAATLDDSLSVDDLFALTLKTGEYGVKVMALLDEANTSRFGNPEITEVNIGVRKNPAILVSGHDLTDLEQLLEQTKGTGVDVYTHGEMLPAHYYPAFKSMTISWATTETHGGSRWKNLSPSTGLFCLLQLYCSPRSEEVRRRIFTTGSAGFPGCKHIEADENGKKDFSEIIELAKTLPAPDEIETGSIVGGLPTIR